MLPPTPRSTLFPYTTLFRSAVGVQTEEGQQQLVVAGLLRVEDVGRLDAGVVASAQVHAVALARQRPDRDRIELQQEDAPGVGAVDELVVSGGVHEGMRVDRVG